MIAVGRPERRAPSAVSALIASAAIVCVALAASHFKPTQMMARLRAPIDLQHQVPAAFAGWHTDVSLAPVVVSADVQAKLDETYDQLLTRTYADGQQRQVMLSIAYGSNQSSDGSSVHRPEFCYSVQGFALRKAGDRQIDVGGQPLQLRQLVASSGARVEPISYWVIINDQQMLPGIARKLAQLRYGLSGKIPDGLLFRISSIGLSESEAFRVQEQFVRDLYQVMDPAFRSRYFGEPR